MPQNYNDTIHKMATPFEMRAGLPKKGTQKCWRIGRKTTSTKKMIEHNADLPRLFCMMALRMPTVISIWVLP